MQNQIPVPAHAQSSTDSAPLAPRTKERRHDLHKRAIVDISLTVEPANVLSRIEYLQSRDIEPHIIKRVLLRFFASRTPLHPQVVPSSAEPAAPRR